MALNFLAFLAERYGERPALARLIPGEGHPDGKVSNL
jgi:hypothetical protein